MSSTLAYKGFVLTADVYAASGGFLPILTMTIDRGHQMLKKIFTPPFPQNGYTTRKQAIDASLHFGAAVIDGNVPRQTVSEM